MGRMRICVVEGERGSINLAGLNCGTDRHYHVKVAAALDMVQAGLVEWIKEPKSSRDRGIVRVLPRSAEPTTEPTKENYRLYGLSSKVGPVLAAAVRRQESWALTMLLDIRRGSPKRAKVRGIRR